jgi:starch-binding outer membrane protein, SusD/RagB family
MKKLLIYISIFSVAVASCKKDYNNPNAPTDAEVLNSSDGIIKLIVGIKQRFAVNVTAAATLYQSISSAGLSTGELTVLNAGNADLAQLQNGLNNLAPNNAVISSLWSTTMVVNSQAGKVIENAGVISDVNTRNSAIIYGHLYKAMAIGTLAQFWEQVPINTGDNAPFSTRQAALTEAVKLLDDASTLLNTTTIPASFLTQVGNQINIRQTLNAMSARYNVMLGNWDAAIAKATAVDQSVRSTFFYNLQNPNPIFRSALTTNNVFGVTANFGLTGALAPDPADKRIAFYLTRNAVNGSGFFLADDTQIPVYLPGEIKLILAEGYARKNDLPNAKKFLDEVLTKTTDAFGLGASLPAYSGAMTQPALLTEIYRNRCIELYMSGLKLEDSRRFNRPGPNDANRERTRNFYPYPQQERDGNSNTPPDPAV